MKSISWIVKTLLVSYVLSSVVAFGNPLTDELKIRFSTERLTPNEKVELLNEMSKDLDLYNRIQFYVGIYETLASEGLPQSAIDQLQMKMLGDIERVPRGMFTPSAVCMDDRSDYAFGCLANHLLMRDALRGTGMSAHVAQQYLSRIFNTSAADRYMVHEMGNIASGLLDKVSVIPERYRMAMSQLIHKRVGLDSEDAEHIIKARLSSLDAQKAPWKKEYRPFFDRVGYQDRLWIYQEMVRAGQVNNMDGFRYWVFIQSDKSQKVVKGLVKTLELSASLEKKLSPQIEESLRAVESTLTTPDNAVYVNDVIMDWLRRHEINPAQMDRLITALARGLAIKHEKDADYEERRDDAISALRGLIYHVQLSQRSQQKLFALQLKGDEYMRYRLVAEAFDRKSEETITKVPAIQEAFEQLAASFSEKDTVSERTTDSDRFTYSNVGWFFMRLRNCDNKPDAYPGIMMGICADIKSTRKLYQIVAANSKMPQRVKDMTNKNAAEALK